MEPRFFVVLTLVGFRLGVSRWVSNNYHSSTQQPAIELVTFAQHRAYGLGVAGGHVLDRLVGLGVELVPGIAEGL